MFQTRKIAPDIHIAGGSEISHSADSLVYALLLEDGKAALIDSGAGPGFPRIEKELAKLGVSIVTQLLTTHVHIDHVGGHTAAQNRYNCIIVAHETAVEVLESGNRIMSAADLYGLPLEPCKVNKCLEGESGHFSMNHFEIHWLHIPGHTPDSVVYYLDHPEVGRILFAQDAHGPLDPRWGSDRVLFKQSLKKLVNLKADVLCEGHFGIYSPASRVQAYLEEQLRKF
ncbi:MAG: MBL fold metallo-hydrolase [Candidatus Hodarchaeales archaeon]|jgi:glyoxylase-like metal-dependent hydrolase (beta-lactamase superfamily II)